MRPLDLTSISAYPGRLRDQLLFYNTELATVRCMRKLTVRNGAHCIKAKSGLSFPPELWVMILNQAEAMALQDPKFSFVKIQFIATMGNIADAGASSDTGKGDTNVVQCAAHKLDLTYEQFLVPDFYNEGELLAGSLLDPAICEDLERFLRCATAEIAARINAQEVKEEDWDTDQASSIHSPPGSLHWLSLRIRPLMWRSVQAPILTHQPCTTTSLFLTSCRGPTLDATGYAVEDGFYTLVVDAQA